MARLQKAEENGRLKKFGVCLGKLEDSRKGCVACEWCKEVFNVQNNKLHCKINLNTKVTQHQKKEVLKRSAALRASDCRPKTAAVFMIVDDGASPDLRQTPQEDEPRALPQTEMQFSILIKIYSFPFKSILFI